MNTPLRASASVALGVFIGCLPLYGLHFWLCALVCLPLRLDFVTCYLAANISNPFFAPFLLALQLEVGARVLHGAPAHFDRSAPVATTIARFGSELAVGAPLVGAALALLLGLAAFLLVSARRKRSEPLKSAITRCRARYQAAARGQRYYVSGKLNYDPISEQLLGFGPLGAVVDLGSGRGQLGLLALELGLVEELVGFDSDAEKVALASQAAAGQASFKQADLSSFELEGAGLQPGAWDTVLLVDVLHYLPESAQRELIERATELLKPGGRLILREAECDASSRSRLTRFAESVGLKLGVNRGERFHFLGSKRLHSELERCGLRVTAALETAGSPLANTVLIGVRPAPEELEGAAAQT